MGIKLTSDRFKARYLREQGKKVDPGSGGGAIDPGQGGPEISMEAAKEQVAAKLRTEISGFMAQNNLKETCGNTRITELITADNLIDLGEAGSAAGFSSSVVRSDRQFGVSLPQCCEKPDERHCDWAQVCGSWGFIDLDANDVNVKVQGC